MRLAKRKTALLALTLAALASAASASLTDVDGKPLRAARVEPARIESSHFTLSLEQSVALDLVLPELAPASLEDRLRLDVWGPKPHVRAFDLGLEKQPQGPQRFELEIASGEWETGLYYARHRFYDPELGRFISADPLEYVDGPNVYAYARNNPLAFTDPMGLCSMGEVLTGANGCWGFFKEGWSEGWEEDKGAVSTTLSFAPGLGEVKDAQEALTGVDLLTGERLSWGERATTVVATAVPFLPGKVLRGAVSRVADLVGGGTDDVVEKIVRESTDAPGVELARAVPPPASVPTLPKPDYGSGAGRRGSPETRAHIDAERDRFLEANPEYVHVRGGTDRATGAKVREEYLPGPGGGRRGSSYPDLTFEAPDGSRVRLNTVDTDAAGNMTTREQANFDRIFEQTLEPVIAIPKPKKPRT